MIYIYNYIYNNKIISIKKKMTMMIKMVTKIQLYTQHLNFQFKLMRNNKTKFKKLMLI